MSHKAVKRTKRNISLLDSVDEIGAVRKQLDIQEEILKSGINPSRPKNYKNGAIAQMEELENSNFQVVGSSPTSPTNFMAKFTFERESCITYVKFKRKIIGAIYHPRFSRLDYIVSFVVEKMSTEDDPASFKWINVSRFNTEKAAREWINENVERIFKLDLYFLKINH